MRHTDANKGDDSAGFIAQEVLAVADEFDARYAGLVDTNDPDRYMVSLTSMIPMMVNAIKELSTELSALKAEVSALKQQA